MDENDVKNQDIYLLKEDNKLYIQDFEQTALDKQKQKELKRKHHETFGYGSGEDMDESDSDDDLIGASAAKKRSKIAAEETSMHNINQMLGKLQGQSATKILEEHAAKKQSAAASGAKGRREAKLMEKK